MIMGANRRNCVLCHSIFIELSVMLDTGDGVLATHPDAFYRKRSVESMGHRSYATFNVVLY